MDFSDKETSEMNKEALLQLDNEKRKIEKEITDITEFLTGPNMPGISGGLVDSEGFPRGDIDIYQIRTMRNKLCCLQTDHKRLMSRIEEGLFSLHSTYMKDSEKEESKEKMKTKEKVFRRGEGSAPIPVGEGECLQIPFVWVAKVDHNSPAQEAGLQVGDAIVKFAEITSLAEGPGLSILAQCVKENLGNLINIKILRTDSFLDVKLHNIKLVPKKWEGEGYLGCLIKPNPV